MLCVEAGGVDIRLLGASVSAQEDSEFFSVGDLLVNPWRGSLLHLTDPLPAFNTRKTRQVRLFVDLAGTSHSVREDIAITRSDRQFNGWTPVE